MRHADDDLSWLFRTARSQQVGLLTVQFAHIFDASQPAAQCSTDLSVHSVLGRDGGTAGKTCSLGLYKLVADCGWPSKGGFFLSICDALHQLEGLLSVGLRSVGLKECWPKKCWPKQCWPE